MNDFTKQLLLWVVIFAVVLAVFRSFTPPAGAPNDVSY